LSAFGYALNDDDDDDAAAPLKSFLFGPAKGSKFTSTDG